MSGVPDQGRLAKGMPLHARLASSPLKRRFQLRRRLEQWLRFAVHGPVPRRLIGVTERLLRDHLEACSQPAVRRAGSGELPTLLDVSRRAVSSWPPPGVLLDRQIPRVPGVPAKVPQDCFLHSRGRQTVV
jgi:hypothetical protein